LALVGLWISRPTEKTPGAKDSPPNDESLKVVRIPTNAEGKIDVSQLFSAEPEAALPRQPAWDPAGIEEFSFENCDGRTISKQDLLGRPWVATFVFTKCLGPCPILTRRMRDLQDRFKSEDFRLVTFTVDPDRDTPEALRTYAELNGADLNRWHFLTGDVRELYGLIHRSFQMPVQMPDETTGNYQVEHSRNLMLIDAQGVVQAKYDGTNDEQVAALSRDLRRLLQAAAETPGDASSPVVAPTDIRTEK
jgi:cytochrome oxidase Cu insertion factor (SCO1/SenC/PrrC family)